MGFLKSVLDFAKPLVSAIPVVGPAISSGLDLLGGGADTFGSNVLDLGGKYLQNELIGKPNAEQAYQNSMASSAYAFQKSQEAYKERYQNTMADMRLAGLNPILAAGSGGFSVGKSPEMSPAQSFMPAMPNIDLTSSALNMAQRMKAEKELDLVGAETEKKLSEIKEIVSKVRLNTAYAMTEAEKQFKIREETKKVKAEEKEVWNRIKNLKKDIDVKTQNILKMKEEVKNLTSKTDLNRAEIKNIQVLKNKIGQEIEKLKGETIKIGNEIPELQRSSRVYKGPMGVVLNGIKETVKAFLGR